MLVLSPVARALISGRGRFLVVCARPVQGGTAPPCCSGRRHRRCRRSRSRRHRHGHHRRLKQGNRYRLFEGVAISPVRWYRSTSTRRRRLHSGGRALGKSRLARSFPPLRSLQFRFSCARQGRRSVPRHHSVASFLLFDVHIYLVVPRELVRGASLHVAPHQKSSRRPPVECDPWLAAWRHSLTA